jgi:hypothetical protein
MLAALGILVVLVGGLLASTAKPASADLGWWHFKNGTGSVGPCLVEDQGFFVDSATCAGRADLTQQWMPVVTDPGWFHIVNRQSGHCIGFNNHPGDFGQTAFTTQCSNGDPGIEFAMPSSPYGNQYFVFKGRVSGMCLQTGGTANSVYQLPCTTTPAQSWRFIGPY